MGVGRTAASRAGKQIAPKVASGYVRTLLDRAIDGVGPIKSARSSADAKLVQHGGVVESAVKALVTQHSAWGGMQGFVTNLGGISTAAVTVPANITGVAVVQCHLVAGIVYLRGYDLEDPRVRNAILSCMLGRETVESLVQKKKLPTTPMSLATSPVHDPALDQMISAEVTTEIIAKITGRRAATLVGRRIPLLGGAVGASTDAFATWQIGTYTLEEMCDRRLYKDLNNPRPDRR